MNWFETLKKVGEVAKVAVPLIVPSGGAATAGSLVATAVGLIEAAVKDGKISEVEIAIINQFLIPHGLAIIHIKEDLHEVQPVSPTPGS